MLICWPCPAGAGDPGRGQAHHEDPSIPRPADEIEVAVDKTPTPTTSSRRRTGFCPPGTAGTGTETETVQGKGEHHVRRTNCKSKPSVTAPSVDHVLPARASRSLLFQPIETQERITVGSTWKLAPPRSGSHQDREHLPDRAAGQPASPCSPQGHRQHHRRLLVVKKHQLALPSSSKVFHCPNSNCISYNEPGGELLPGARGRLGGAG